MSFQQPLGFLILIAVPVLILIYIIKSKYTEEVITSTYLWELSERFLKRKNPLKRITGILNLILQILAVVFIALAVAHPVFVIKGGAYDYCFILDSSASMNICEGNDTRYDTAKAEIRKIINSSADGSTYTLISAGNTTDMVYNKVEDKKSALNQLNQLNATCAAGGLDNAVSQAQKFLRSNKYATKFYLVTDKVVENYENVEIISVKGGKVNYGLSDVSYIFNMLGENEKVTMVSGSVFSYEQDATLTVEVFVDSDTTPVKSVQVQATADAATEFSIEISETDFYSITLSIKEKDDLPQDNSVTLYGVAEDESYKVLIVSKTPLFIEAQLKAANMDCEVIAPEKYSKELCAGYSLYVFDSDDEDPFAPDELPSDGAVWFINPSSSVKKTGFTVNGVVENGGEAELSTSTNSTVKKLLYGTNQDSIAIKKYVECDTRGSTFYKLLYCNDTPVIFAGENEYGNREVVIAFDLNYSISPLFYNGLVIFHNLINYTFPSLADETLVYCGESVAVNILPGCTSLKIVSPSGEEKDLNTDGTVSECVLTEVGEHIVTAVIEGGLRTCRVYAQFPEEERTLSATEANFEINGTISDEKRDGKYDDIMYIIIILGVLILADWAVYCYEQYQLR